MNKALVEEKKSALFNYLKEHLSEEQWDLINKDLTIQFEKVLDASKISSEKIPPKVLNEDEAKELEVYGKQAFLNFAMDKLFNFSDIEELKKFIKELNNRVAQINRDFRNQSAHPQDLNRKIADSCYDTLFPTQKVLIDLVKKYKE